MKILILSFLTLITFNSCKKDTSTICENLLKQGMASPASLHGEWEFENFAYTANGKEVKNKNAIQKGYISISDTGSIWFYHTNSMRYEYFISNSNDIITNLNGSTYINPPQEEIDVSNAFGNSQCFVVKGNNLLIHYSEKDQKNVLVLTKK